MKQVFTVEEVEYIKAVANKLIAGETLTQEEMDTVMGLSDRLAEEMKKGEVSE